MAETKGSFSLNERLPIAFDAGGSLEVDLLCAEALGSVYFQEIWGIMSFAAHNRSYVVA